MQFYNVHYATYSADGWPWAWQIRPHPMQTSIQCDVCRKGVLYPGRYPEYPITADLEGGTGYPDVLACSHPLFIVSEAVISDWKAAQVTGYELYPLAIGQVNNLQGNGSQPPHYYHVKVTGRCQLDLDAMGVRITYLCPKCGYRNEELANNDPSAEDYDPFESFGFVIREETWDRSDLFVSDLFECVVFCSQKVFDLAGIHQRTNFRFMLPERYGEEGRPWIDYLSAAKKVNHP